MITVEEALKTVLSVAQRLEPVTVPLHEAHGKILAQDIQAPDPLPPYPASIKVRFQSFISKVTFLILIE